MTDHPDYAYKLLAPEDARTFDDLRYTNTTLDRIDGYVHLSTKAQLAETARRYYSEYEWCLLLEVNVADRTDVRWEASRGGDLFPHIYGKLALTDVERRWMLKPGADGELDLPGDLK